MEEAFLILMERFFRNGISPREFRKNTIKDIRDVSDIQSALEQKSERERKINEALSRMR